MTVASFSDYCHIIQQHSLEMLTSTELLKIAQQHSISSYYAPFDFINTDAKIVIVGICPGRTQWLNALTACKQALTEQRKTVDVLRIAKQTGAFSGAIRQNLVKILDHIGLNQKLDLASTATLFDADQHFVHMSSLLRQAIFIQGRNYAGSHPNMLKSPFLVQYIHDYFVPEVQALPDALYIPLGQSVIEALHYISSLGYLKESQILTGFPHPSGANAERIQYFLGLKAKESLSSKTNATKIDQAKAQLIDQLNNIQL